MKLGKGYVFVFKHPFRFNPAQLPEPRPFSRSRKYRRFAAQYVFPIFRFVTGV